jgi:hypothetical protein
MGTGEPGERHKAPALEILPALGRVSDITVGDHVIPQVWSVVDSLAVSQVSVPVNDPLTARRSLLGPVSGLVAGSTIDGVTDDDEDRPEPPSAKVVTALLREARSLSRRADKLSSTAAGVDDPTTQHLVAEACTSMEQLVHHLMLLERQAQRGEKSAARRR